MDINGTVLCEIRDRKRQILYYFTYVDSKINKTKTNSDTENTLVFARGERVEGMSQIGKGE